MLRNASLCAGKSNAQPCGKVLKGRTAAAKQGKHAADKLRASKMKKPIPMKRGSRRKAYRPVQAAVY